MTITPLDIQNKEFERAFRGYDIEDVDEFLDRLAKDLELLMRENLELKEQLAQMHEKNKNYQKMEDTMHNAIVVAQGTADDIKNAAKREAELIKREAESEAKQIIEDARYRSSRILGDREELFKQAQVFKMRFRSFIEAQLATLEREDWLKETKESRTPVKNEPAPEPQPLVETTDPYEPKPEFDLDPDFKSFSDFEPEKNSD